MNANKIWGALAIVACATTCSVSFANGTNGNEQLKNPSMQEQGENLEWLKDRLMLIEEKALTHSVDRVAAAELKALQHIVLETAQKAASSGSTPPETLSKIEFFSGDADCNFASSLAKIVNVQGKLQLGLSPADCNGLTVSQVKQIDFSKLDLSGF